MNDDQAVALAAALKRLKREAEILHTIGYLDPSRETVACALDTVARAYERAVEALRHIAADWHRASCSEDAPCDCHEETARSALWPSIVAKPAAPGPPMDDDED